MIMELAMVNNMQDVNGNERFISVAPTWATITSAVRFHDKRQQAMDDEEDAAGRPTATLQFPLGAAVPGQLQSFDHARLFLLDDNLIHRDHAGDVSLNFQEVLNSLISPTDLQTIEYHETPQDELYCTSDHTAYCILDRSAGGGSPCEEGILSQAMYNNNIMLPQAAANHETNLPFIDLRDVSQSDDLQHLNHTYISCTHSHSDGDEGVQPSLTTQQMMIPVASFQTPLVFLTDSTVCGSRLLAEYSAVTHSVFAENGDEPIDQSTRPSNSLSPNTSSPPARKKRKRMLPMNSAVSLEAAESNQVADAECEVDSHGCKLDDSLLGGETWRQHWDVDMNLKCGEQENIQDEEFSSNLRNSETHTVKKGVAQNQHDAECLWHSGPEDAPQEISPHIQPGDSYTLETPTNSKVMYITCSATEQRPCETMVGVEESTELAKDPEDMAPRNDTLMKLMGWSTEEASYEHEMPLNSCTSCWQLDEAQYEVQLPSLLESGRESSEKHWGCIPVTAERSIDCMDREPLLPSQHPGASSVEESIKGFFNDVPASSPNLNKRMIHSGGPEEIGSSILNEGYPPEGCCAEDTGKGVLKTFISTGVNALSSLSPNGTIGLLGKFPQGQMELLNSPSNQLGYQESKLIVGHLMTSEATSIAREMGESWSTPSDLQTSVPDLKKKSLLNRQDVQILPAVITQRVSKLEVARAKQRPPRNRCKKPKGTRSEQALPDYNQIRGIPRDQHSLTTMQPSEKNDSLSLKSEGIDGEEKGGDRPLIVVKTSDSASKRSSQYRGVTRHRYTGRYEAHLWDNSKVKTGLSKRGRQVYLGAYQNEEQAARAHDSAALKYWGPGAFINFPIDEYKDQLIAMENFTKEEYILLIRRRSPGFARGRSKYRGVTRHHQDGRWEARIGREPGAKYHYLGIFDTQEEAAMAYDRAAVECRGVNAVTNFQLSSHLGDTNKSPSHPAVPHGGEKSSEADSQGPAYDPNHEPAVSGTSLQKLREEDLSMSSQVLNSIDWLSPSVVLRIPMYRSRVLLPPSCELEGMITKACEALEGRVITATTTNLSKRKIASFYWASNSPPRRKLFRVLRVYSIGRKMRVCIVAKTMYSLHSKFV